MRVQGACALRNALITSLPSANKQQGKQSLAVVSMESLEECSHVTNTCKLLLQLQRTQRMPVACLAPWPPAGWHVLVHLAAQVAAGLAVHWALVAQGWMVLRALHLLQLAPVLRLPPRALHPASHMRALRSQVTSFKLQQHCMGSSTVHSCSMPSARMAAT